MARPRRIDRDTVLVAALAIADADGLDSLSMRAVAERLEVTPMALYRYVGGKQELLDGLVERLLLEWPLPQSGQPWRAQLTEMAASMRATARRHPQVFPLLLQRSVATAGAKRVREAIYEALREAGVDSDSIPRIERVLSTFIIGFAASEAAGRFSVGRRELDLDVAWFGESVLGQLGVHTTP